MREKTDIRTLLRNNAVTIMFIIMCAVCFTFSGQSINYVIFELMSRLSRNAFIVLALIIGATGLGVGWSAVGKILSGGDLQAPAAIALVAAAVSILAKEWMFRFTRRAAKRIQSDSLMANALNYRSDVFSSCGVLVGVAGAQLGFPVLDAVASLIICVLILKSALEILLDALSKMLDSSIDGETLEQMRDLVTAQPGVLALDDLKTRQFGSRYYVDVEIACDGDLTLRDAHAIAVQVHDAIEKQFPGTKHCLVHVNPFGEDHSH